MSNILVLKDGAEKMKVHINTLKACISNPLLARHVEENERYLEIAIEGLLKIENEILLYKKVQ